ncbi:hypothetical protein SUDANB180_00205 [Streptomyces sp. enrichment culture]
MYDASSEAGKTAASATSSGVPVRPRGMWRAMQRIGWWPFAGSNVTKHHY